MAKETRRERLDKYLEQKGLLNYQTEKEGLSAAQIAQRYADAGVQVRPEWFKENYREDMPPPQFSPPQVQIKPPQSQQAGGNVVSPSAPTIQQNPNQNPNLPYGYMYSDKEIQYVADPKTGLRIKVKPGMVVRNPEIPWGEQAPKTTEGSQFSFATIENARAGDVNWTDVATDERKKLLSNPSFYKNNEITKYPAYIQQQILADPALDWSQLPKWQQTYFSLSSSPAAMGTIQGGAMGSIGGLIGGVGGAAIGAGLGYLAGKSGYDITKEAWQQDTKIAKAFGYLNWLAEQAEKALGAGIQAYASATMPNEYGTLRQLWDDREAAWNAGAATYERLIPTMVQVVQATPEAMLEFIKGLPEGKITPPKAYQEAVMTPKEWYLGASTPVRMDEDFIRNIYNARERIKKGEDYRAVMMDLQTGVAAQLGDMAGQIALDPLNILPRVETKIGAKIAEVTGNKVAAQALSQSKGLNEAARRYKTLVQTPQALIIDPKFQVDQLGWLSRMAAGVNKAGEVKAGSLIPSETGLLSPVKDKAGFIRSMTEQTPHARAETGANMFYENISTLLTSFEDPHEAGRYLKALANSDMETWAELGSRFAESPEFYTVLPALKEFNASKLDGIIRQWDEARPNRDAMLRMANLLGEQPAKWLEDTAKRGTFEQDFQRLKEKVRNDNSAEAQALKGDIEAGRITPEFLKQIVDLFTGEGALSWHAGQWKALMLDALGTHFDEWVTKRLMLDKSAEATSAFYRTTALMKQAQSILLLGGSPGYAITNGLSNMVHRAVTGIYGYMTPNQINTFLDRMGVTPARMEEGVGIGGQVEQMAGKSQVKTEAMTKAVRGKGALTTGKDILSKISRGMPMSKLSSWFEKVEGRQGFAIAMKQFWSQSWRRGVGFKTMRPELVNVIKEMGIAPERIYAAIEAGMNQGEIEKALFGRYEGVQARALIHDAAQKTGLSASQAAEMLEKTGALDTLDNYLKGQTTKDGVQAAFTRAERVAQDYIDMQTGEDLKASAEAVKQRVGLEGAASALDVMQKTHGDFFDAWFEHFGEFGEVFENLKYLDDPGMKDKAIDLAYQHSDDRFRRIFARTAANYTGVFEALGISGHPEALKALAAFGEINNSMKSAYDFMRETRKNIREKYKGDYNNPDFWNEIADGQSKISKKFEQAFAEKHQSEVKLGKSLAAIYEGMYGPAAGEAALKWWEDVTAFNDEIVKREQDFRKRLEGLTKDQRDIAKQKYYSETKIMLIAEADRINGEGIARLERVIKKGRGTAGGGAVSPVPTPPTPLAPDQSPAGSASAAPRKNVDELNALLAAAEQRKGAEAKVTAERLAGIWDIAEEYWGKGTNYSRGILQDKFALLNAIRKVEYGGIPDLKGLNDTRLTPELVRSVMEARKVIKATQATEAAVTAFNQPEPVKKRNLDPNNMNLLQAIAGHGGLNMAKAKDLLGEKRPRTMQGVFTKKAFNKGWDITDMARYLANDGFEIDLNHPDDLGGAKQATDLLNRAIIGDKIYPMGHDYSKALDAAEKAYIETFNFDAIPEVPFDQTLWQTEFANAVMEHDLTKIWGMIGDVPESFDPNILQDYVRLADETAARVEAWARDAQVKENLVRAEQMIAETETRAEAVTTGHLLKEKFQEAFGLDEAQAQAWMELSDSIGGWYAKTTGESADAMYARYYGDVVKGDEATGTLEQAKANRVWYSKLTQTVEGINQPRMTVEQLRGALVKAGVKADEIKWMGLDDFMQGKKNITKAEALDFLRENQVQVEEVTKGYDVGKYPDYTEDPPSNATKFSQHTLPGGENYREVLFTLPRTVTELPAGSVMERGTHAEYQVRNGPDILGMGDTPELARQQALDNLTKYPLGKNDYRSPHWNEPNVLAHVRLDDRVDADGKRVLFVEEVQSDWHQAGREKGYQKTRAELSAGKDVDGLHQKFISDVEKYQWGDMDETANKKIAIELADAIVKGKDFLAQYEYSYNGEKRTDTISYDGNAVRGKGYFPSGLIPYELIDVFKQDKSFVANAPFSKTWHELVMKRVLRMAAEEGYDRVGWTTGEQQAARYDLSKQVDAIDYWKVSDGYGVRARKDGKSLFERGALSESELADIIGKDAAKLVIERQDGTLSGLDLRVGGEGMKGFYDKMLPAFIDKYAKKWGAKTGETKLPIKGGEFKSADESLAYYRKGELPTENVHSVDVTPAMRESVMQGQPLFQAAKGAVTFDAEGIKATIHAFEARDFSTLVHENGHVFRRMLADVAERTGNETVKADLATIEKWAGVKDGKWERAHEEKFARGFEEYITEGKAPTPALARVFESFKRWMLEIYKTITGSVIDVKVTDEVRGVFDRMLGGEARAKGVDVAELFQGDKILLEGDQAMDTIHRDNLGSFAPKASLTIEYLDTHGAYPYKVDEQYRVRYKLRSIFQDGKGWGGWFDGIDFDSLDDAMKYMKENGYEVEESRKANYGDLQEYELIHNPTQEAMLKEQRITQEKWKDAKLVYLRYGLPPKEGKSYNTRDQFFEQGVSVYRGEMKTDGEVRILRGGQHQMMGPVGYQSRGVDLYVVEGKEIGLGSDGEPVMSDVKVVGKIDQKTGKLKKKKNSGGESDGGLAGAQNNTVNRGTVDPDNPNILFQEADQPFGAYDAASGFHPLGEAMDQGWSQHVRPLLEAMQEGAVRQLGDRPLEGAVRDMSPEGQAMLRKYMKQVQGEMASTKLATVRWGENQRDFALLNYNKRYGIDKVAEALYPYQLYYTRSLMTWAARTLDKPALYSNYARLRMQQDRYERDIPERLRGKIKISAPWLPEWMGGNLYIDPLTQLFFPANLLRPFERAQQDKNYQMIEAERILQEWTADGTYSESQASQAAETQSGTVWERALAEAQIRRESEIANPFDFFSTMFGPAWYLSTPLSLAGIKVFPNQGEPGKVNTTPLYNTIRGLDTVTQGTWAEPIGNLIGMLGKPEEWLRKKLELPEFGELTNYYVDKQLSNMVAEGLLTSEQATIVMIERQGEFFEQARERVKMEMSLRVPTMGALYAGLNSDDFFSGLGNFMKTMPPSLFGSGLLPAGELEYRGLKQEWDEMWKRADAGDTKAKQEFFDKYPEYEAYLAKNKWDEPEERLKSFLIGQIWDGYYALGETNRKQFVSEAGMLFDQSFLDKETRSYDTLDVETLTQWARMLNKKTPTPPLTPPQTTNTFGEGKTPRLDLYSPAVTTVTDEFFNQRTKKFPNFYEEQTGYYALPKSERSAYLLKTPGLKEYWDWKDAWYKKYPQYVPIFSGKAFQQVDTSGWPPGLVDYVISYAYTGKKLPSGAYKALEQQWILEGMPMDDLKSWLDAVVAPAMLYGPPSP